MTQGETIEELSQNAHEALNLLLDEPENSKILFPLPAKKIKSVKKIIQVKVDTSIGFAFLMRRTRIKKGLSQQQMKKILNFKTLFSYQKLEKAKYANPTLKSLTHIKECLPDFPLQYLF
ncbi:MAG: type II toxin-antitoxin system HicB family antitoxin [Bdellovibrionota bacterium]